MADIQTPPPKGGRFVDRFTTGNLIELVVLCGVALIAWGSLTADFKALAQRVDKGETRDEKTADALDLVKGAIIELRVDGKATRAELERQGRQLDRIESYVKSLTPPASPPRGNP